MSWEKVQEIIKKHQQQILSIPGVVGVSTGVQKKVNERSFCIKVYCNRPLKRGEMERQELPDEIEGVPVEMVVSGDIVAFDG